MRRSLFAVALAVAGTLPGVAAALLRPELPPQWVVLLAGSAILAASFLLLWACDAAQAEVSQSLALAAVALVAVLPEYAVDMYFTWQAGRFPQSDYAHYAIANMTGANRLIIGVAWPAVAVVFFFKARQAVFLGGQQLTEVALLAAATAYALFVPLKGSLTWVDGLVLLSIYVWYMRLASQRPCEAPEVHGPAAMIVSLPKGPRRAATILMFGYAALVILANAERFSEGLLATGRLFGISEFLLVQWLAPVASEAPEFTVALMFAARGAGGTALGSLLSAKLNQWTLLVGMIPLGYALSSGSIAKPIPLGSFQMHEILLTAAQSLLAVTLLATLRLSLGHAALLFLLFSGQLVLPNLAESVFGGDILGLHGAQMHAVFALLYLAASASLLVEQPYRLKSLWTRRELPATERCKTCRHRAANLAAEKCVNGD